MITLRCFLRLLIITSICLNLFACGTRKPDIRDGAPLNPPSRQVLDKIPNAVPKIEPLSRYGNRFGKNARSNSYVALKRRYTVMSTSRGYRAKGLASWYGTKFQGRKTSSGEPYNMYAMTAAHPTLPLPTYAKVTNLDNGKEIIVKVNDRGPFHSKRLIDLSYVAAHKLGILGKGTARVEVESIDPRDHHGRHKSGNQKNNPIRSIQSLFVKNENIHDKILYLQLGVFNQKANAEDLLNKVGRISKSQAQISMAKNKKSTIFKVWMGPFHNETEAKKLSEKLTKHRLGAPIVITKQP